MLTSAAIKARARELGFDLCGIAPAESFRELGYLRDWLNCGYAGEMAYMSRTADRRADVRHVVPGARSVIVTGTVYNTVPPYAEEQPKTATALISRYAWGDDYHDVLKARLETLLEWMRAATPAHFEARAYVDTGPVQERVYAQYAGLGWIGRNTCLINPELGSWLFLAEIISTLPLDPDAPGLDQCGSCTRCLDACPTGALAASHVLDATRCISYLTIEIKGGVPIEWRPAIGTHVYGCDICQDVCPYNQAAPRSADAAWQARAGLESPPLLELWRTPDAGLQALVSGSPMTRAKLVGLRRNVAVAIGNSGDEAALAALHEPLPGRPSVDDPLVREHVEWAIGRNAKEG